MMHSEGVKLVGRWVSDPIDSGGQEVFGNATIEFMADGRMTHTIHMPDKDQIVRLSYEIENGLIITDQPSSPRRERTKFAITPSGKLELWFEGQRSVFIREE